MTNIVTKKKKATMKKMSVLNYFLEELKIEIENVLEYIPWASR
jgi:hypothetical protein